MAKFEDFKKYWFTHKNPHTIEVFDKGDLSTSIRTIHRDGCGEEIADATMLEDFKLYQTRPEYQVGIPVDDTIDFSNPANNAQIHLVSTYKSLMEGIICLRAFQSTKDVTRGEALADRILSYLDSTDFFDAPASTMYHESVTSGLVFHSLKVYNEACMLSELPAFSHINVCKWALVSLVHDWCKIGLYEGYMRNVKNDQTGQWEKIPAYKVAAVKRNNTLGHGATSMFMISQFIHLSLEEALAIRWHMGAWNVCDGEINDFQDSNEQYPLVHMLQFADQLAITKYESARYGRKNVNS